MIGARSIADAWRQFWHAPIDAAPLALFRQAWAWTALIYFGSWARFAPEWLTEAGYHPPASLDPSHAAQLPLLPEWSLPLVGVLFFGSLLAYIFGFARRYTVWVLLAGAVYAMLVDPISAFTINRLFVIGWLILAVAPESPAEDPAESSTDMPAESSGGGPVQRAWPTRMLQLTVVGQYFASGLCKALHGDWWVGEDVLWMQMQGVYMTDAAAWMLRVFPDWAWDRLEDAALWFELLAPLMFGVRRLLPLAIIAGLGMHLIIALTMDQLIYFSLQMMCFYILFLPSAWCRRLLGPGEARAVGEGE